MDHDETETPEQRLERVLTHRPEPLTDPWQAGLVLARRLERSATTTTEQEAIRLFLGHEAGEARK